MNRRIDLLVEGWRGINHSYAMVNQYQLLELLQYPELALSHLDVPFAKAAWNATANSSGFSAEKMQRIMAIPPPAGARHEVVYRIAAPFRPSETPAARHVTFMTSEFWLTEVNFAPGAMAVAPFCGGRDVIVVPSNWSRMKLVEFGFPPEKVFVVSHGVAAETFSPLNGAERLALRQQIGVGPDDFVFLNLGAMTWNKGLDVLLQAFAEVRRRHAGAVLVLKDDPNLYGIGASTMIQRMTAESGWRIPDEVHASIKLISVTLTLPQMRLLYGAADRYVSPYRAEGFNLPVIEAIACGTPAIVSRGGATDDFCEEATASFIDCRRLDNAARNIAPAGYYLEPELDSLVACMDAAIARRGTPDPAFAPGRARLLEKLSWANCVRDLVAVLEAE